MLYKDLEGNIVGESIFANGNIPDLLISIEFLGPVIWALIKSEDGTYFRDSDLSTVYDTQKRKCLSTDVI